MTLNLGNLEEWEGLQPSTMIPQRPSLAKRVEDVGLSTDYMLRSTPNTQVQVSRTDNSASTLTRDQLVSHYTPPAATKLPQMASLADSLLDRGTRNQANEDGLNIISANTALRRGDFQAAERLLGRTCTVEEITNRTITPTIRQSAVSRADVAVNEDGVKGETVVAKLSDNDQVQRIVDDYKRKHNPVKPTNPEEEQALRDRALQANQPQPTSSINDAPAPQPTSKWRDRPAENPFELYGPNNNQIRYDYGPYNIPLSLPAPTNDLDNFQRLAHEQDAVPIAAPGLLDRVISTFTDPPNQVYDYKSHRWEQRGNPRYDQIREGRGLPSHKSQIGGFVIDKHKLHHRNEISLTYANSGRKISDHPNVIVGEGLKEALMNIIDGKAYNTSKLQTKEINYLNNLLKRAHESRGRGVKRQRATNHGQQHDLDVDTGEIAAGNDSTVLKRNLHNLLSHMVMKKKIPRGEAMNILQRYG